MVLSKEVYIRYYTNQQQGGSLPVFRGGRHDQDGAGLGDILQGIFRHVAPIAMSVARRAAPIAMHVARRAAPIAARYAANVINAHQEGVPIGEAAKSALLPAIGDALQLVGGKRRAPKRRARVAAGGGAQSPPAKRRKRVSKKGGGRRRKPQVGCGSRKRVKATRKVGQKGGRKKAYKAKQRGGARKRSAVGKKRGGGKRTKGRQANFQF
jgi:hypothetical protein